MRACGSPLLVRAPGSSEQTCRRLERAPLTVEGGVSERFLQELIHEHPALLPIGRLEPTFEDCRPVCLELPTPSGFVDNLMITPRGDIVLVETKLWRNPEARRKVVGQILDYAKDLSLCSYSDLEKAVRVARREPGAELFALVSPEAAPEEEAGFIDAVSRNLRRGRMLLVVAGDGIREGAEQLADFLQSHVSLNFSLAMVELTLWRLDDGLVILPQIPARTLQIERAVIRMETGEILRMAPAADRQAAPATLSEETFYEALADIDPDLPNDLKSFLTRIEPLGIEAVVRRNMMLRRRSESAANLNLGAIDLKGRFVTDYANWPAERIGRIDLAHDYQKALARILAGHQVRRTPKANGWRVVGPDGSEPPVRALLSHQDDWAEAMNRYGRELSTAAEHEGSEQ